MNTLLLNYLVSINSPAIIFTFSLFTAEISSSIRYLNIIHSCVKCTKRRNVYETNLTRNVLLKCLYQAWNVISVMYLCVGGIDCASFSNCSIVLWKCADSVVNFVSHCIALFFATIHSRKEGISHTRERNFCITYGRSY